MQHFDGDDGLPKPWPNERPGLDRPMTRDEIGALPLRRYDGPVEVVRSASAVDAALKDLRAESVLGFDSETRPSFRKGEVHPPALLQLAGSDRVFIFQLASVGLPTGLRDILSAPGIVKAGVAVADDVKVLSGLQPFRAGGMVDLARLARQAGVRNFGLRGLAAVVLGFRISKSAQVSNWARAELTREQVRYAATDAWVSREVYLKLVEGRASLARS